MILSRGYSIAKHEGEGEKSLHPHSALKLGEDDGQAILTRGAPHRGQVKPLQAALSFHTNHREWEEALYPTDPGSLQGSLIHIPYIPRGSLILPYNLLKAGLCFCLCPFWEESTSPFKNRRRQRPISTETTPYNRSYVFVLLLKQNIIPQNRFSNYMHTFKSIFKWYREQCHTLNI